MKQNEKRHMRLFLAILLSLAMVMGSFVSGYATTFTNSSIAVLNAVGSRSYSGNIVLQMPFEGDLADISQNPVSATSVGTDPTYQSGVETGQSINLFSNGTYIDLGTDAKLNPSSLSVSFWVRPNGLMSGENIFIWTKDNYNTAGWYLGSPSDTTPLVLSVGLGSGGSGAGQPYEVSVTGVTRSAFFPANTWTHVAVTFNESGREAKVYRNGMLQTTTIGNVGSDGIITNGTNNKVIGRNGGHGSTLANYSLDDLVIFDAALSQDEIIALHAETAEFDSTELLNADAALLSLPSRTNTNVMMSTKGANGSIITWSTNNAALSPEGVVNVPSQGDVLVEVTATLTHPSTPGKSVVKTFEVIVFASAVPSGIMMDVGTDNVTLFDDYLLNAEQLDVENLLGNPKGTAPLQVLEPKRFLYHFYITAGLTPPAGVTAYEETWERSNDNNFRGHMFGHYMSSLALAYNASADPSIKAQLLEKIQESVNELKLCQDAFAAKYPDRAGYIAPFGDIRLDSIDGLSGGVGTESGTVFVPWYNLHKVLAGLLDIHKYIGNDDPSGALSLEIAKGFGDYFYNVRTSKYTETNKNRLLATEYGGMNESFYELYNVTGDVKYRINAEAFDETTLFNQLANRQDVLPGKHANTQIPKFIGALKRYTTLTQNSDYYDALTEAQKDDLATYLLAAENFFDIVLEDHSYITGGNSQGEHFRSPNTMAVSINREDTHETCNAYNMLKLARELFKLTNDKKYSDYYENAFINAILSSLNPETGEMMYFHPMGSGYNKVFRYNRFWCCTGTGIENFVKLGDSIYFKQDHNVYVNMYFSSEYKYNERNLSLTQVANMPNSDTVNFTVDAIDNGNVAVGTNLYFRVPDWCAGNPVLKVNDVEQLPEIVGGYISIQNVAKGDTITLTFPMEVSLDALEDNTNVVAFRYGPVVLSTGLGSSNMNATNPNGIMVLVADRDLSTPSTIIIDETTTVEEWKDNITKNLVRVEDSQDGLVQFRLKGTDMDDRLVYTPHYRQYKERYGLYMTLSSMDSEEHQAKILSDKQELREIENASAYLVNFDDHAYEAGYNMQQSGTSTGTYSGKTYRHGNADGAWFSYDLPIVTDAPNFLNSTLARADSGRSWRILINDVFFENETVVSGEGTFYTSSKQIPTQHLTGDQVRYKEFNGTLRPYVTVKFERINGYVGGIFGLSITQQGGYDTNPNLRELTFDTGVLSPAFDPEITEYTLTVDSGVETVVMNATPWRNSGLVYMGNILFDDTQTRTVSITSDPTVLVLNTRAQDHTTVGRYVITIGTNPQPVSRTGYALYATPALGNNVVDPLWANARTLPVDRHLTMESGSASGIGKVLWDKNNLYVMVTVTDPVLNNSSSNMYEQDSVEVFVDEQNIKSTTLTAGSGTGQYRVSYTNQQSYGDTTDSNGFNSWAWTTENGYVVLMKIPFKTTTPVTGEQIGLDIQINDANASGSRQDVVMWFDQSGDSYRDASGWGTATLTDKSSLQALYDLHKNRTGDFTFASWTPFVNARNEAAAILANTTATQEEIDAAIPALQTAVDGLVRFITIIDHPMSTLEGYNDVVSGYINRVNGYDQARSVSWDENNRAMNYTTNGLWTSSGFRYNISTLIPLSEYPVGTELNLSMEIRPGGGTVRTGFLTGNNTSVPSEAPSFSVVPNEFATLTAPIERPASSSTIHFFAFSGEPSMLVRNISLKAASQPLESIAVTALPNKRVYQIGEQLDLTGLVVTGTLVNGSTRIETITPANIIGFDSSKANPALEVMVDVDGQFATFTVEIGDSGVEPGNNISTDDRLEIVAISLPDEDSENFNPEFELEANTDMTVVVSVAQYDKDGEFEDTAVINVNLVSGVNQTVQPSLPIHEDKIYKFFIWDSQQQPLTNVTALK